MGEIAGEKHTNVVENETIQPKEQPKSKEAREVTQNTSKELEKLKKEMTFDEFKNFLERLKSMEEGNRRLWLSGLLSVLNTKGYSIRLIQNGGVEIFQANHKLVEVNLQEISQYNFLFKNAINSKIISIKDISNSILAKSMVQNDFDKETFGNDKLKTSDYFVRVLAKYGLKLSDGELNEKVNIGEDLKTIRQNSKEDFERFRDGLLTQITNISDKEFVRAYLDDMYFSKECNYKDNDVEKIQSQVKNNKDEINKIISGLDKEIQVKLGIDKYSLSERMSKDPMGALQEGAMNGGIMYAVVFGILGKLFGGIFGIKHMGTLGLIGGLSIGTRGALGGEMKDMPEIWGAIKNLEIWNGIAESGQAVWGWGKELYGDTLDSSSQFIEKLKVWYDFKDVKIAETDIMNYNFVSFGDKLSSSVGEIIDGENKISQERLKELKTIYNEYKNSLIRKERKNWERLKLEEPYKSFTFKDIVKYVNTTTQESTTDTVANNEQTGNSEQKTLDLSGIIESDPNTVQESTTNNEQTGNSEQKTLDLSGF